MTGFPSPGAPEDMIAVMAAELDEHFIRAGSALGLALQTSEQIAEAMAGVNAALEGDASTDPVDGLLAVATRIGALAGEQSRRRTVLDGVRGTSKRLTDQVEEIFYTLRLLTIYGMNVKIAALGAAEFVTVMDEMLDRMAASEIGMRDFRRQLEALAETLTRIDRAERLLAEESAKAIPAVPDRLAREAAALRAHRLRVSGTARASGTMARAIHGRVGAALGALQIGDITRQRLEHVATALTMIAAMRADPAIPAPSAEEAARHVLRLLAAQMEEIAADYDRETGMLVESLDAIVPDTRALIAPHDGEVATRSDPGFLHRLQGSIAETEAVTRRLRQADHETETAVQVILDLVRALAGRPEMVRRLQRHVQQLAFNIGLRSNAQTGNGGILVASEHIRVVAGKLDTISTDIAVAIRDLEAIAQTMRDATDAADTRTDPGETLSASMAAIGAGATRSDEAVGAAGGDAARVLNVLVRTCDDLRNDLSAGETMRRIGCGLAEEAGPSVPVDMPAEDSPLHTLLPRIAALYTMASERVVHRRFLPPGLAIPEEPVPAASDGDDGLFDDALF